MKRIYLTPEIIDTFAEPKTGETWLADSAVPGFGVRIWHRNGKIGKAYAVRAADEYGRFNRIALRKWELQDIAQSSWRFALGEHAPTFGELLPEARLWARDQIDRLTGRPTLADERRDQWARSAEQAGKITLARAAAGVITTLELGGRSQVYRDRLDKLFSAYVPENLKKKPLVKITLAEIASVLRSPVLSYGNMRALRPFLGKCIDLVRQFHGRTHESLWDFERMIEIKVQTVEHPMVHWESSRFNLVACVREMVPIIGEHETLVTMHNDAVIQGLSEMPAMQDVAHWAVLTIGTGLGNATYHNRAKPQRNGKSDKKGKGESGKNAGKD